MTREEDEDEKKLRKWKVNWKNGKERWSKNTEAHEVDETRVEIKQLAFMVRTEHISRHTDSSKFRTSKLDKRGRGRWMTLNILFLMIIINQLQKMLYKCVWVGLLYCMSKRSVYIYVCVCCLAGECLLHHCMNDGIERALNCCFRRASWGEFYNRINDAHFLFILILKTNAHKHF